MVVAVFLALNPPLVDNVDDVQAFVAPAECKCIMELVELFASAVSCFVVGHSSVEPPPAVAALFVFVAFVVVAAAAAVLSSLSDELTAARCLVAKKA